MSPDPVVRDELRPGDLGAILEHHGRVYAEEYGVDSGFEGHVARTSPRPRSAASHRPRGDPDRRADGEHAGSVALTDEGAEATIRWFLFSPEVRGRGLGRRLLGELLARADEAGYVKLVLETFSELGAAAHLYRDHGFEVVSADAAPRWGRDQITYQRYELTLSTRVTSVSA
jgi:ribosomal protein S18 acetylase RimI-like enzyme